MAISYEYTAAAVRHFATKLDLDLLWFMTHPEHFTVEMVRETIKKAAKEYAEEEMKREEKVQKELDESPELLVN